MSESPSLILNGSIPSSREASRFAEALGNPKILTSTGGYLFKSRYDGTTLHIGIVPAISEGQRLHHYDITVPEGEHLLGNISATGEITLLFRASETAGEIKLDDATRKRWNNQFSILAESLVELGYQGEGKLDWITRQIIEESGIFHPVPGSLADIIDSEA